MTLSKRNADRCLHLLWEYRSQAAGAEQKRAYERAISGLHAYLTDVLPATLPCVRAKIPQGVIELFPDQDAQTQDINLLLDEGDRLGVELDRIHVNEWPNNGLSTTASPIAIAFIRPNSAAAKDNRLARGDQVLSINGHSLSQVSLQRARWLLDSAERSQEVLLSIIASGLIDGLKHSISRHDVNSLTPRHRLSRSRESLDKRRVQRLLGHKTEPDQKLVEKKSFQMEAIQPAPQPSLLARPGFTPSIGSRHGSDYSLVSSTVETAAYLARSSMHSSKAGTGYGIPFKKRKVRKMHIMKGASGLGLRIIGGKGSKYGDMGIFVRQLEEGGAAFNDRRLHPGDELLMVDGKSLVGLTHDEAVAVLKTTQKLVQLVVATEHIEGESLDSSLQSIPENMANLVSLMDRQLESGQSRFTMNSPEHLAVAPEALQSLSNAFEMQTIDGTSVEQVPTKQVTKQVETAFEYENTTRIIQVRRSEGQRLGFSIKQGTSGIPPKRAVFVQAIDPDGAAGRNKELCVGDELLRVNGIRLENCTREEALDVLTATKGELVTLEVTPPRDNTKQIVLRKIPGQPLGIQLTSQTQAAGAMQVVTVKTLALGSPAHTTGKLCPGDQMVSVNGMSVFAMNVVQVKGLLASISGEEIELIVKSNTSLADGGNLPSSNCEKTRVEQDACDNASAIVLGKEMDFTMAPQEVPQPVFLKDSTVPLRESTSSKVEESGEESDNHEDQVGVIRIAQSTQSRPESSIIELTGDFKYPETLQSISSHSDCTTSSLPPAGTPPALPPDTPPSLPASSPQEAAPGRFLSMLFKIKKRPRAGLGITLIASEGSTSGYFMVRRITPNGAAAKDSKLQIGDRLVSVNGLSLFNVAHATVLQTLNEARKEIKVVVWRDPYHNLSSPSMHSLGSYSNMSGSHSSLRSEDFDEDASPLVSIKRRHSRGLPIPAARNSPLIAQSGYSALELHNGKRWSNDVVLAGHQKTTLQSSTMSPPDLPEEVPLETVVPPALPEIAVPEREVPPNLRETTLPPDMPERPYVPPDQPDMPETMVPSYIPPDAAVPPNLPETALPPDLPETAVPPNLPEVPPDLPETALPPNLPETALPPNLPEVPPDLPETANLPEVPALPPNLPETAVPPDLPETAVPPNLPEVPPDLLEATLVPEVPATSPPNIGSEFFPEVTSILPELPSTITPPDTPPSRSKVSLTSIERNPDIKREQLVDNRPPSLQVPRGERTDKSPFEIELRKGIFGLGASLIINEMGMLVIDSLSSRSIIYQDGNIKVGDVLLSINDESMVGLNAEKAEAYLKNLPRGPFRLTVMAPFKDVTGEHKTPPQPQRDISNSQSEATDISQSEATGKQSIVKETLQHGSGCSLGFEIEGGSDTPLKYIYVESLPDNFPAFNCGKFSIGDQIIMVGNTCLIGMTCAEAKNALELAPAIVEVVVQRISSSILNNPQVTVSEQTNQHYRAESTEDLKADSTGNLVNDTGNTETQASGSTGNLKNIDVLESTGSTDDLLSNSVENLRDTDNLHATIIPEDKITLELRRRPGKKLGISIVGGTDNPNLRHIHVKQVIAGGVAASDGRMKRGDRILSVNDQSVAGLSNKEALQLLKNAGEHVNLVMTRKVGRRSRATTPLASARHSRQVSGDNSCTESRRMSPQRSPKIPGLRKATSSSEGSPEGSRGASPQHPRRHQRRKSVTAHGEVLTFRDKKSTLPRQIKGAKVGVHLVELHKGPTGLGLQLHGSADSTTPITVKAVLRGGPAFRSGKIHTGDEIIEVNGTSFESLTMQEAVKAMKSLPQGTVSIILRDHKAIVE